MRCSQNFLKLALVIISFGTFLFPHSAWALSLRCPFFCDTFGAAAEILFIPPDAHFIQEFAPTSVQGSIGSATSTFSYSLDARSDLASASMGVKSSMFGPANTAAQAESYLRDRIEVIGDFSANPKPAAIITIDAEGNWTGDAQYVGFEVYGHFGYPQPDGTFIWDSGLDLPALPSPFMNRVIFRRTFEIPVVEPNPYAWIDIGMAATAVSDATHYSIADLSKTLHLSIELPDGFTFRSLSGVLLTQGTAPTIPEPGTLLLVGVGLAGLGFSRRKRAS